MRKYDIAYVPNGAKSNYYPVVPLEKMSLQEITKKYISMCGKANGRVSVCSKCHTPCKEGKRAIQLLSNAVYNDPPVPLYAGKTAIEMAKEENMKRRKEKERKMGMTRSKNGKIYIKDWYKQAVNSGNPVKWIMETYGFTERQAKNKLCVWKHSHKNKETHEEEIKTKPVETNQNGSKVKETTDKDASIENKIDSLMKLQETYKKEIEKYTKLYEETKTKVDILCNAIDIMNG